MKYLITGGSGQLGSAFLNYINKECKGSVAFNASCNINDTKSLSKIINNTYDAIVNFAGIASVQNCDNSPIDCYETNTISVEKTLEILKNINYGGKYINIGSINEFLPNKSEQTYAKTKIRAREIIAKFREDGLKCYQYTIGVCLSDRKTKNIGSLLKAIYSISDIVKRIKAGDTSFSPVLLYDIDTPIRFSSCKKMAQYLHSCIMQGSQEPYIDSQETTLRGVIASILYFAGYPILESEKNISLLINGHVETVVKIVNAGYEANSKKPDIEIPEHSFDTISRIVGAILEDKLVLN